ncbi:MAG: hypothetical protein D6679_10060 [Candidatus Hydrogenedentota bacterium]|nr:MAG: hypothetical protein D6679_10060 [Candidatus Hydrogenedentota bacterium]
MPSPVSVGPGTFSPYRVTPPARTKPMAGAMGIVFVSLGFVMVLASRASATGASGLAIFIIATIVILFTIIDVEFGLYCLVAGMLLSPEIPLKFIKLPQREVVIRIDDIMIILVSAAWFAQVAVYGKLETLVSSPLNRPILWFSFLTIVSTARGVFAGSVPHAPTAFFYVLKFLEFFLLYFLVLNTVNSEEQVKRIMSAYLLTLVIVVAWATWTAVITKQYGRATTPFETEEEPGTLGGYLLFSFALCFGLLNYVPNIIQKIFYFLMMVAIVPPFLYTLSRGSYMAFFPMFLTILFLSRRKAIPLFFLIILAASIPWLPSATRERVEYTFQNRVQYVRGETPVGFKEQLDPSSAARLQRYKGVVRQWKYKPLLGQGVTGVGFVDSQIVRVLGELGILGLLTLIWLFRNLFQTAVRLYRALPVGYMKGLVLGMIAGSVGLIFHGATANTFIVVRIAGPFWVLTGLVMVIERIHREELQEA